MLTGLKDVIKSHKLTSCAVLLIIIFALGLDIWILANLKEDRILDTESVAIVDNPTLAFGAQVHVSDFISDLDGTLVDDFTIEPSTLGDQEIEFEYINIKNRKRRFSFTVKVVDSTPPTIYGSSSYMVAQGYQGNLTDLMLSIDDLDDEPTREIIGDYDTSIIGSYVLEYVITDASHNQTRKSFTLNVVEPSDPIDNSWSPDKLPLSQVIKDHKTPSTKIGVDVSQWQGTIDWSAAKAAGVEFAFIRIGYQRGYGGEYIIDPYFEQNFTDAKAAGLPVGVYFYSYADNRDQASQQADWILEVLAGREAELGIAFDWEDWSNLNSTGMSLWTFNRVAKTFLERVSQAGYKGLLYGSKVYFDRIWDAFPHSEYDTWLAQYYDYTTYVGDYAIWQMSCTGQVDGIDADVDIDIMYLDQPLSIATLIRFLKNLEIGICD